MMSVACGPRRSAEPERALLFALPLWGCPSESLRSAFDLARRTGMAFHVVRVLPAPRPLAPAPLNPLVGPTREAERLVVTCRQTRAWCDEVLPEPLPVLHVAVRTGEFVSQVAQRAHELQAHLVSVPPMQGRAGSIVAALARATSLPVLVARPAGAARSFLAAADLADESYPILRKAADLAREVAAEVLFFHDLREAPSREPCPDRGELQRQRLLRAAQRWAPGGTVVITRENNPARAIVRQAAHSGVDTIVVGTRPRPWLARRIARTVAAQVVERADRSVLVVPIESAEPPPPPAAAKVAAP